MSRKTKSVASAPVAPVADNPEKMAAAARARRAAECEREVQAVLQRYGCSLQTRQMWVNGQPSGSLAVVVVPMVGPEQGG